MTKKISRMIAALMLFAAAGFFFCALNHPEKSFPWNNRITFTLYGVYLAAMTILFIAPFRKKD